MTAPNEAPSVTQADRDLLASFYLSIDWLEAADQVRVGDRLSTDEERLLDDIARHREQAEDAAKAREAKLVEALEKIAAEDGRGANYITCYWCSDSSDLAKEVLAKHKDTQP